MRNVLLNMSMSLDGYVASDRDHAAPMNEIPKVVFSKTLAERRRDVAHRSGRRRSCRIGGVMGKVVGQAIMSLDGYVAKQDNTIGRLFDWLQNGEVELPTPAGDFEVHLTPQSAAHWRGWVSSLGALVWAGLCSTSLRGGTADTHWTCRSSSSPTAYRWTGSRRTRARRSRS